MDTPRSLEALLGQICDGDADAFAQFYDLTCRRVYAMVTRVVRDRHLGEDVTQEIYLHVWTHAQVFRAETGTVWSWLATIAHHRAVDTVRQAQHGKERDTRYALEDGSGQAGAGAVEAMIERLYAADAVPRGLAGLTCRQRESIMLAYYSPLTYRQVADRLSIGLPAVKARIHDGLHQLREQMGTAGC